MSFMLTTVDNPFDPRTDYASWYAWDVNEGYNTCAYLDRVLADTDDFPIEYDDRLTEQVIDEIIELHAGGLYQKLEVA